MLDFSQYCFLYVYIHRLFRPISRIISLFTNLFVCLFTTISQLSFEEILKFF